jgi:polyhydroxybutyrate depolymerase
MNTQSFLRSRVAARLFCAAAMASTLTSAQAKTTTEDSTNMAIHSGGLEREFVLHVGTNVDSTHPAALVVALHGSGGNGKQMEHATGFDKIADRDGFIVAYPSGIGRHWNDGRRASRFDVVKNVDDVQFLRDLVAAVEKGHKVDVRRVFCTGMSNGGFMANRAGVEASDLFAAIAPVSGTLSASYADRITPKNAISVLVIHGTKDGVVPYQGGAIGSDGPAGICLGAPEIVAKWIRAVDAAQEGETRLLPDTNPNDGCRVTESVHVGPRATVEFLSIAGGIHVWPGGGSKKQGICHDIDGSEVIWGFFKAHPKP